VIGRQIPPCSILLDAQPMSSRDVPAKHAARPTAIQAHHGIWRDRSADRHRWSSRDDGFCCRFTKTNESLVDSRNQSAELIGPDLITSQIGADDLHSEFSVGRCSRRFVGHFCVSPLRRTAYHTRSISDGNLGSPYPSRRSSTIFCGSGRVSARPHSLSCMNSIWEVKGKIYGGDFRRSLRVLRFRRERTYRRIRETSSGGSVARNQHHRYRRFPERRSL
jgi:hypothetical protein